MHRSFLKQKVFYVQLKVIPLYLLYKIIKFIIKFLITIGFQLAKEHLFIYVIEFAEVFPAGKRDTLLHN